jgi:predicted S18 family serine protease
LGSHAGGYHAGAAASSGTAYLNQVQRLLQEAETEKQRGNYKAVATKFNDAANAMMDMVEQQRWPPGEERRQAISTARRYISTSKSYEAQGNPANPATLNYA